LDGTAKKPLMLFSDMGGIDIEQVAERAPDHVGRGHFSTLQPFSDFQAKQVIAPPVSPAARSSAPRRSSPGSPVVLGQRHAACGDQPLAELQTVVRRPRRAHGWRTRHGRQASLIKRWHRAEEGTANYTPSAFEDAVHAVDAADHAASSRQGQRLDGNIGLNHRRGGGSLTLTDAVRQQGANRPNYSEIGGNPSVAKACGLAKAVLQKDGSRRSRDVSIVSNTRVDIVARGHQGLSGTGQGPPRRSRSSASRRLEEEGFKILDKYGIEYCDRSVSLWEPPPSVAKIQGPQPTQASRGMSILINENTTFIIQASRAARRST